MPSLIDYLTFNDSGAGPLTATYNMGAYPRRALIAKFAGGSGALGAPWDSRGTVVTYGGLPLVLIGTARYQPGGPGTIDYVSEIWRLLDPPAGAGAFSFATLGNAERSVTLLTAVGIDQATPFGVPVTTTGNAALSSLSPASSPGDVVADSICVDNILCATLTPGPSQVLVACDRTLGGLPVTGGRSQRPGGAASDMSWSWLAAQPFAHIAVAIKPYIETIRRPIEYTYDIWETNPQVRDAAGRIVPPGQVRANRWIRLLGATQPTSERPLSFVDDPEIAYIEGVQYDGETGRLTIQTSRGEFGDVIVARAAGKSTA